MTKCKEVLNNNERLVTVEDSAAVHKEVFERIVNFCAKHEAFTSEGFMQRDNPQIAITGFMSDLICTLNFEVTWKDEDDDNDCRLVRADEVAE